MLCMYVNWMATDHTGALLSELPSIELESLLFERFFNKTCYNYPNTTILVDHPEHRDIYTPMALNSIMWLEEESLWET